MPTGKVKWYNQQRGYGFITPDNGGADIFLHRGALTWAGVSDIGSGQPVSFEVHRNERTGKESAMSLRLIKSEAAA
jgi:cold shock protein